MFLLALLGLAVSTPANAQQPPPSPRITVQVRIDFGGSKPVREQTVEIAPNATVVDVTRAAVAVEQDWLCCSPDDVWAIDGVGPDPRLDQYWSWRLDGKPGPDLPARHRVVGGETISWHYGPGALPAAGEARIVSLLPAATEIVLALGGDRSLVGLSHLCRQPDGAALPRLLRTSIDSEAWSMVRIDDELRQAMQRGDRVYTLDDAAITALRPTHVFSQGLCPVCAVTPEQVAPALANGTAEPCAKLVELSPRSLAGIAADIRTVGEVLGRGPAGKIAARAFERRLDAVRALPPLAERPRVVVLEWFEPLWGSGEWIAEMVEVAGGAPVLVQRSEPSRRVTWDQLVAADPDVIVLAACSMSLSRTERELPALTAAPAWQTLRAVTAGQVFVLDGERQFSTPGPGVARGAEVIARILREPGANPAGEWRRLAAR